MESNDSNPKKQGPGFIKLSRSAEVDELMRFTHAFLLLTQIARRAVRADQKFNPHNLTPGQALIGDHQSIGASLQNYRTAKDQLDRWGFATFKPTNKGTVATLLNTRVYDINIELPNNPANNRSNSSSTNQPPTPSTTNKEEKKVRTEEEKNTPSGWYDFLKSKTSYRYRGDYRHAPEYMRLEFDRSRKPKSIGATYGVG